MLHWTRLAATLKAARCCTGRQACCSWPRRAPNKAPGSPSGKLAHLSTPPHVSPSLTAKSYHLPRAATAGAAAVMQNAMTLCWSKPLDAAEPQACW